MAASTLAGNDTIKGQVKKLNGNCRECKVGVRNDQGYLERVIVSKGLEIAQQVPKVTERSPIVSNFVCRVCNRS